MHRFAASVLVSVSLIPMCVHAEQPARLAVVDGTISFGGEKLRDVLAELNRRNRCQLVLVNQDKGDLKVSGNLPVENLPTIVRRLWKAFDVRVRVLNAEDPECGVVQLSLATARHAP